MNMTLRQAVDQSISSEQKMIQRCRRSVKIKKLSIYFFNSKS